ncbi:protein RoBo-1-like [Meriones unguiculatus]|uniref:protein RoBo-1-like n=1 Tax=Meriones unguiculatus TaxID=10047 RepID=UPI00293F4445|nr:protein RoBo-1-like [Meriones unguiculatus]
MAWSSILKSLLLVFVFAILAVSSVENYTCEVSVCMLESCIVPTTSCTATKGCFSRMMQFETPSTFTDLMLNQKGCTSDADTCSNLEFSATLGDHRIFRYKNRCCTTEQCNKENITVPSPSSEPNGVRCAACYSEKGKSCKVNATIVCTGNEKKCVEVTGTVATSTFLLYGKGCATENACDMNTTVFDGINVHAKCIPPDGSPALKSISSLPVVLLLLKVLL